jgi:hypothetical protein
MGSTPILFRSRQHGDLLNVSPHSRQAPGLQRDHIAGVEFSRKRVRRVLGLDYDDFYRGMPITTMSYDWFPP